ncbi:mitochondrial inner membrane protein required for protein import [Lithohypha guttulata]|uniref:mitochondrial inner membrane protein required for protein import n=1 Tax=Lithohypha guttulata TaxID=1690604 RepID=UPI002DE08FBE|nr:mitochondrial inner membrane protein required for protein import [Lithohypha guttulata]
MTERAVEEMFVVFALVSGKPPATFFGDWWCSGHARDSTIIWSGSIICSCSYLSLIMLRRAVLPLVRPHSLKSASRLTIAQCQTRGIRSDRARLHQPGDFKLPSQSQYSQKQYPPQRPVPRQAAEDIQTNSPVHDSSVRHTAQPTPPPQPQEPRTQTHRNTESVAREQSTEPLPSEPLPDLRQGIPSDYDPDAKPNTPLPDLTQGIPSTIDAELSRSQRQGQSSTDSLNITADGSNPQSTDPSQRGGDGLPRSSYVSSSDRRRSALTKYFYAFLASSAVIYALYMGRDWSEEEAEQHKDVANGYTPGLMYARAMARWGSTMSYYKDPVTKKLLPDAQVMDPNMPPYTLVLGLEDVLVHSEWSREHGWRIAKRPGLDYFVKYLSPYYELVIFSAQPSFTVDQIHRKIDPYQMVYPLFREMTVYEDGGYVKDLSYLNRDLSKVIVVDSDPHHVKKQPENAIVLPKWNGDPNDTTLIDLIPFLENVAALEYKDTREVIKSFDGKYIPVEFDRRQKLLREKWEAQQAEKRKHRKAGGFGLGSIFGGKPRNATGMQSIHDAEAEGKHYTDIIRERGQEMYLRLSQHLEKEGPKILAEREAAEKKMQEEMMQNMKSGMFGWFGSSQPSDKK